MSVHPSYDVPWQTYRDVRLRALATDPEAFGSTSEREMAFPDERWIERASNPGTFLWFEAGATPAAVGGHLRADGLIGLYPATLYLGRPDDPQVRRTFGVDAAHLTFVTQMWVDPAHRGVGADGSRAFDALMDAVLAHARETDHRAVALHVFRANERAAVAYRRHGFALTAPPSPECPADEDEYVLPLA